MKKIFNILVLGALILTSSSCKKFLDVNKNPNNPTDATPELVLPQAIVTSASSTTSYDNFGAWTGGYKANAGGYGGWGTVWTYNFSSTDYNALWTSAFNGINQLNVVINKTDATGTYKYFNAVARVMKSYLFTRLVDQYGDVPYSETGLGLENLTPKYDKYTDVYKACYDELNAAIAIFDSPFAANTYAAMTSGMDPLFGGTNTVSGLTAANITKWKQFANTIKLKMVVRAKKVGDLSAFVSAAIPSLPTTSAGYITDDALVNPGYSAANGNQFNPQYAAYTWSVTGASIGQGLSNIPTPWIVSMYNGVNLTDPVRGAAIYASFGVSVTQTVLNAPLTFTGPATNQLGFDTEPLKRGQNGSFWYSGIGRASRPTGTTANSAVDVGGVLKGATMGQPLMLHAESKFLQAEASLASVGILPALSASTKALFTDGIAASFKYLYKNANNVYFNATPEATLVANYVTANITKPVVNFDLATTDESKLEAIITQKYIAVNMINSEEGFNEYRRTGYPKIVPGSTDEVKSFASLRSTAPAVDKLPTRVLYPNVELQVNTENVPKGISAYTTKIFYAK